MKLKRWLRGWIIAALVAPFAYLVVYLVSGYSLFIVVFWPGSLGLTVLEGQPPPSMAMVALIWSVSIMTNVLLYTVIGLLLWPFARIKSQGPMIGK